LVHPLQRAGEITFYEELGVARDATSEEIRDSFRALARLLHPDQQTDPQLKEIAERQMRKVNHIYSVLSDPEKRRRYDAVLFGGYGGPTIVFSPGSRTNLAKLVGRLGWVGAIVVALIALGWLSTDSPAAHPPAVPERSAASGPSAPRDSGSAMQGEEIAQLRADLKAARVERDIAYREISRLRGSSPPAASGPVEEADAAPSPARPLTATAMTELPVTTTAPPQSAAGTPGAGHGTVPAEKSSTLRPSMPAARLFAGFWFFMKSTPQQRNKGVELYPPEFIEATISEQNGVVHGKYRSRYRIVDRAISPDVTFEFSGTPNGTSLTCPWTGPGGSRGDLILRVTAENALKVDWTATELGSTQGLVSGTATLTRRID